MSGGGFTLAAAPLLPWLVLALLAMAGALCLGFGILRRAPGLGWRAIAIVVLLAALVNPSLIEEQRVPRRDVAIIIVDDSPSQSIGDRRQATETALAAVKKRLAGEPDLDVRVIRAGASRRAPATREPGCSRHSIEPCPMCRASASPGWS